MNALQQRFKQQQVEAIAARKEQLDAGLEHARQFPSLPEILAAIIDSVLDPFRRK